MRGFRTPTLALLAFTASSCSSNRHIVKTGERTYRVRCETSLAECLEQVDTACQQGFELREGKDVRERTGVDVVGTGAAETRTSEAVVVCRSSTLFGGEPKNDDDGPRLVRESICTPGASQACVGPGGCAGGQSCLGDGTGYDACDCGDPAPTPTPTPGATVGASPQPSLAPTAAPAPAPSAATSSPNPAATGAQPAPTTTQAPPGAAPSAPVPVSP